MTTEESTNKLSVHGVPVVVLLIDGPQPEEGSREVHPGFFQPGVGQPQGTTALFFRFRASTRQYPLVRRVRRGESCIPRQ